MQHEAFSLSPICYEAVRCFRRVLFVGCRRHTGGTPRVTFVAAADRSAAGAQGTT